jgi:hypothetical protein
LPGLEQAAGQLAAVQQRVNATVKASLEDQTARCAETVLSVLRASDSFAQCDEVARRLCATADEVPACLRELTDLVKHLRVLDVLIKMEVARSDTFAELRAIADDLDRSQSEFDGMILTAEQALHSFNAFQAQMEHVNARLGSQREHLARAAQAMKTWCELMLETVRAFSSETGDVAAAGIQVAGSSRAFRNRIDEFSTTLGAMLAVRDACRTWSLEAAARADSLRRCGVAPPDKQGASRMQQLVGRFAVLADQETAAGVTDTTVEAGDEGGSLTLF